MEVYDHYCENVILTPTQNLIKKRVQPNAICVQLNSYRQCHGIAIVYGGTRQCHVSDST